MYSCTVRLLLSAGLCVKEVAAHLPARTRQMFRGQCGAILPDPDVSRCSLQCMHAAQNLLGSRSRSSGQTHFHILWMFGRNKMWKKKPIVLKVFFSPISSCMNNSAMFLSTETVLTPKADFCL